MTTPPGRPDQPLPGEREAHLSVSAPKSRRRRVVLADPKGRGRVLRTIGELEEQTSVGEKLIRDLIRTQLRSAFSLGLGLLGFFALLPVVFYALPQLAEVELVGVRLPWLVLGLLPFPLCYTVGYAYRRLAETNEQDFVNSVDR
ncbi:hypothetical protein GCM10022243_28670 [Saccharothrix violaceirubra]|uniref:Uncharacterized protein n=1 Tax=Saccharothrix violaceirubra TaxID=413306 RepID=A0A7W7T9U1_9PSEU|nr:hypothetical protein [Saccharothrix violaceirubra]MBB4969208.1 hypothetical protein [Saccharothrix violaceirubra]